MESNPTTPDKPSRTKKKHEMTARQKLGAELARLNTKQLAHIPLSGELRLALESYQNMRKFGARYRQMQYIGRLLREADVAPIQEALAVLRNNNTRATARLHRLERWREQLIAGNETTIHTLARCFSGLDIQHLRQLVRNAQKEQAQGKTPKAARELFRYLKSLQQEEMQCHLNDA